MKEKFDQSKEQSVIPHDVVDSIEKRDGGALLVIHTRPATLQELAEESRLKEQKANNNRLDQP